ncbi:hypothetical protein JZU68_06795 [bacterium]|jgi:hypothetical protein|nr:hypothetical protein [bacterium]
MSGKWGKVDSAEWITTGCLRVNHTVGDTDYNVAIELNQAGVYAIVDGKYNNYCLIYVRTFAGALTNAAITFWIIRAI